MIRWLTFNKMRFLLMMSIALGMLMHCKTSAMVQKFPALRLENLHQKTVVVPHSDKPLTLVIMADEYKLQPRINTWLTWLKQVQQTYPKLAFYEIPVVDEKYKSYWPTIRLFMKRQLPDSSFYSVTLPYFISPVKAHQYYHTSAKQIHVWLTNSAGQVLYQTSGELTPVKQQAILGYMR